mmetsp:Transcript_5801/g.11336  ORF Transcript_5801/g.11336 Transcript_5801/m.11336 type:complete len:229 (-) Transcript_5801:1555-2241(-)
MTVTKRSSLHILSGNTDVVTFKQQRTKCHCFGGSPIDSFTFLSHGTTRLENLLHLSMQLEAFWDSSSLDANFAQDFDINAGITDTTKLRGPLESSPATTQPVSFLLLVCLRRFQILFVTVQSKCLDFFTFFLGQGTFVHETLLKDLQGGRMARNLLIQLGLRECRLIELVVPVTTVTNHINDDIASPLVTPLNGSLEGRRHSQGIITVTMEDGTIKSLTQIRRVRGTA